MTLRACASDWAAMESQAHDPEVQAMIAEAIEDQVIRVVPVREGGIHIIPLDDGEATGSAWGAAGQGTPGTRREPWRAACHQ